MKRKLIDPSEGLKAREEKRKSSVVASIINDPVPNQEPPLPSQTAMVAAMPVIKKVETKSRRKHILLQPSLHDRAEEKCKRLDLSMNEVINQLLANWVDQDV